MADKKEYYDNISMEPAKNGYIVRYTKRIPVTNTQKQDAYSPPFREDCTEVFDDDDLEKAAARVGELASLTKQIKHGNTGTSDKGGEAKDIAAY